MIDCRSNSSLSFESIVARSGHASDNGHSSRGLFSQLGPSHHNDAISSTTPHPLEGEVSWIQNPWNMFPIFGVGQSTYFLYPVVHKGAPIFFALYPIKSIYRVRPAINRYILQS
ncbi:hypothetical protein TNCV_728261 [Trichonephila clavipes]|nr:hypothetical protein TNCV_728261 [Trichonephila clavipes]